MAKFLFLDSTNLGVSSTCCLSAQKFLFLDFSFKFKKYPEIQKYYEAYQPKKLIFGFVCTAVNYSGITHIYFLDDGNFPNDIDTAYEPNVHTTAETR